MRCYSIKVRPRDPGHKANIFLKVLQANQRFPDYANAVHSGKYIYFKRGFKNVENWSNWKQKAGRNNTQLIALVQYKFNNNHNRDLRYDINALADMSFWSRVLLYEDKDLFPTNFSETSSFNLPHLTNSLYERITFTGQKMKLNGCKIRMNCRYRLAEINYSLRMANIWVMDAGTELYSAQFFSFKWFAFLKPYTVAVLGQRIYLTYFKNN